MDKEKIIEVLAEKVHQSWEREKRSQGFHSPSECKSDNRRSYDQAEWRAKDRFSEHFDSKLYKWCDKCHADLYPYEDLAENIKEYDRVTVRTVINAIEEL